MALRFSTAAFAALVALTVNSADDAASRGEGLDRGATQSFFYDCELQLARDEASCAAPTFDEPAQPSSKR
jgi:hypothetical protein